MLKLSRIRPWDYNKSCTIFHNKSNNIGLAFFWNFYDFLLILQISAKGVHYWRCIFATRPLERNWDSQLGPSTMGGGGANQIPAGRLHSRSGKRWCTTTCSPRAWGWPELGRRSCRSGRTAMAGGGDRGGSGFRRGWHLARQCATLGGAQGSRGESGTVGRQRELAERWAPRWRRQWRDGQWWRREERGRRSI
jgi:hypothetical protein